MGDDMSALARLVFITSCLVGVAAAAAAQEPAGPFAPLPAPVVTQPPLAPATKLEGFVPVAGSVFTIGYDRLGGVAPGGVSVEVREMRDARGGVARGLVVEVTQDKDHQERAFVDADELPELLKGIDALLDVRTNPTMFRLFEVRYTTRGELGLIAFSGAGGVISYAVRAGRLVTAQRTLDQVGMSMLRQLVQSGVQKLDAVSGK